MYTAIHQSAEISNICLWMDFVVADYGCWYNFTQLANTKM